jgi:hypothetical protein
MSTVEETYPVFGYRSVAAFQIVPVKTRTTTQRKSEAAWQRYLDQGIWDRRRMPALWISVPSQGKVQVKIWIYDHAGHKSDLVTLEEYRPSTTE